jgi:hypothetical protein
MIIAKGIKIWGCVVVVIKSFCITGGFCITRFVIVYIFCPKIIYIATHKMSIKLRSLTWLREPSALHKNYLLRIHKLFCVEGRRLPHPC